MHSSSIGLPELGMVPKNELFGLEIKQLWSLKNDANRFLFDFSPILYQILNDIEVNLLVFGQQGLYLMQVLEIVDAENLVEELKGRRIKVFQGILVNPFQRDQLGKFVLQQLTENFVAGGF